jgi:hypothetical protein
MYGENMDLSEIGWEGVGWIHLAQYRDPWPPLSGTVINLRVLRHGVSNL